MEQEMNLPERMIQFRARYKMSIKDFADLVGVSAQTVWNLEMGKFNARRTTALRINEIMSKKENEENGKQ